MKNIILLLFVFMGFNLNAQVAKFRYIKVDDGKNAQVYDAIKAKI